MSKKVLLITHIIFVFCCRYIYIPLGGSKHGIFRQVISSVATFGYVYYWHGAYDYLLYWAISQWLGVFIEAMTGRLLKTKTLQHLEVRKTEETISG